jgi:uncharacterized protein YbjT (DUF2867 family)
MQKVTIQFHPGSIPQGLGTHVLTGAEVATLKVRAKSLSFLSKRKVSAIAAAFEDFGVELSDFVSISFEAHLPAIPDRVA